MLFNFDPFAYREQLEDYYYWCMLGGDVVPEILVEQVDELKNGGKNGKKKKSGGKD